MDDTLHDGDRVILATKAYTFGDVDHGDVIVFKSEMPNDDGKGKKNLVKRVIGLPGDKIEIKDDAVYRNDKRLDEDYVLGGITLSGEFGDKVITVPDEKYFCLGDNRMVSLDSRSSMVGYVPEKKIIGKVVLKISPIRDFGLIAD
jgi:signal peptidase I